jgi:hypothetical protein
MTKFSDQLFDDLMREHGPLLANTKVPAAPRRLAVRPVLVAVGAGGAAAAATVGTLLAGGGTPAYAAVTPHPDGTVTLAVYQQRGIAQANAKLHVLGDDRVVVVPAESGCTSISSLPTPAVAASGFVQVQGSVSNGSVTVNAHGIPAGDILVVGIVPLGNGMSMLAPVLTSPPAPSCVSVSVPSPPAISGIGKAHGSSGGPSTPDGRQRKGAQRSINQQQRPQHPDERQRAGAQRSINQ